MKYEWQRISEKHIVEVDNNKMEHEPDPECWCHPYMIWEGEDGDGVWVHQDEGNGECPAGMLAFVIAEFLREEWNEEEEDAIPPESEE